MKPHRLLALVIGLTLPSLSFAQVLVQTSDNQWQLDFSTNLYGDQQSQTLSASNTNNIDVDQYLGALDLTRVVIRILQPKTSVSPFIDGNLSIAGGTGTVNFTSASISEKTTFTGTGASISTPLNNNGGGALGNNVNSVSDSDGSFTLNNAETKIQQLDITNSQVWFDSANTSMTSAQLNTVFRIASNLSFAFDTEHSATFTRTGTDLLKANIAGSNSGQIVVEYYAIPEPSSLMLLGLAGAAALLGRRRRPARGQA